jgi:hypothetical protein
MTEKCNRFCKEDYVPEQFNKFHNTSSKKFIKTLSPKEKREYIKNTTKFCRKLFCNAKCEGFPEVLKNLHKKIKNGYNRTYSNKKVRQLKQKGALSGCIYDNTYDVFH